MNEELKKLVDNAKRAIDAVADGRGEAANRMEGLVEINEHLEYATTDLQAEIDEKEEEENEEEDDK
jgi:hypothetical protein